MPEPAVEEDRRALRYTDGQGVFRVGTAPFAVQDLVLLWGAFAFKKGFPIEKRTMSQSIMP